MGNGGYGQLCFVAPNQNIVIAATSSFSGMQQLQNLLDLVYEHVISQINHDTSLVHCDGQDKLREYLLSMTYPFPVPQGVSDDFIQLDNQQYSVQDNPQCMEKLGFSKKNQQFEFKLTYEDEAVKSYTFKLNNLVYSCDSFIKDLAVHHQEVATYACWLNPNLLELTLVYIETPYVVKFIIKFDGSTLELQCTSNTSQVEDYTCKGTLI
ncbi:hypothetical protein [Paenibacillus mendelii]|uniref:Beta-lactamase-related domain-containing protein n=1 Tax=Paenibacillus mendelii TaxID=206163 RepID=A0ABV6J681_9BACL|nr:hypothetical protein [Paenibacillus mendelii]MCQ6561240.1 hypothetical protein [Paenibacillus mendelii]